MTVSAGLLSTEHADSRTFGFRTFGFRPVFHRSCTDRRTSSMRVPPGYYGYVQYLYHGSASQRWDFSSSAKLERWVFSSRKSGLVFMKHDFYRTFDGKNQEIYFCRHFPKFCPVRQGTCNRRISALAHCVFASDKGFFHRVTLPGDNSENLEDIITEV